MTETRTPAAPDKAPQTRGLFNGLTDAEIVHRHPALVGLLNSIYDAGMAESGRDLAADVRAALKAATAPGTPLAAHIDGLERVAAKRQAKIARQGAELHRLLKRSFDAHEAYLRGKRAGRASAEQAAANDRQRPARRPTWDEYGLALAAVAATRSTCPRLAVGAVLMGHDGRILATGYNGARSGEPHCTDVGCDIRDGACHRAIHAEANALSYAPSDATEGATLCVTDAPCDSCAHLIVLAGVRRVVFARPYRAGIGVRALVDAGVEVEWHTVARLGQP